MPALDQSPACTNALSAGAVRLPRTRRHLGRHVIADALTAKSHPSKAVAGFCKEKKKVFRDIAISASLSAATAVFAHTVNLMTIHSAGSFMLGAGVAYLVVSHRIRELKIVDQWFVDMFN